MHLFDATPSEDISKARILTRRDQRRTSLSPVVIWTPTGSHMRCAEWTAEMSLHLTPAQYHSRQRNATFDTLQGKSITKGLNDLAKQFTLSMLYGTAPHDFTLTRYVLFSSSSAHSGPRLIQSRTGHHTRRTTPCSRSSPRRSHTRSPSTTPARTSRTS